MTLSTIEISMASHLQVQGTLGCSNPTMDIGDFWGPFCSRKIFGRLAALKGTDPQDSKVFVCTTRATCHSMLRARSSEVRHRPEKASCPLRLLGSLEYPLDFPLRTSFHSSLSYSPGMKELMRTWS